MYELFIRVVRSILSIFPSTPQAPVAYSVCKPRFTAIDANRYQTRIAGLVIRKSELDFGGR